jgi:glycosyltransferase involved in cell wall biosynthesis
MNRDNGAGVEFEGNLFIEILKRTIGIDNIDVYSSQCRDIISKFDFSAYDLIILNDFNVDDYKEFNNINIPIINISFGGGGGRTKDIDIIIDLNMLYTSYNEIDMYNYYPLNFISGNIWNNHIEWNDRSDDILYVARLSPTKIVPEFLEYVRSEKKTIDFYGQISDKDYYKQNKDVINYKGYVNHKELVDIYNQYKLIYLWSTTECLSMTLREAILCGTVPIVYDDCNYTKPIENYIFKHQGIIPFQDGMLEISEEIHDYIESNRHFLENYFSFDKMVLDFIFCIRGLTLRDLKFDKDHRVKVNQLHNKREESTYVYENDTINWHGIGL